MHVAVTVCNPKFCHLSLLIGTTHQDTSHSGRTYDKYEEVRFINKVWEQEGTKPKTVKRVVDEWFFPVRQREALLQGRKKDVPSVSS